MKKILFDVTEISEETRFMSIPLYKMRLLDSFDEQERSSTALLAVSANADFIRKRYPLFTVISVDFKKGFWTHIPFVRSKIRDYKYAQTVNNSGCDAVFIASDVPQFCGGKVKPWKVNVVHDLKTLKHCGLWQRFRRYLELSVVYKNADVIVPISFYTKDDLISRFPWVNHGKLKVVYNSINLIKDSVKPQLTLPSNYILWVNTVCAYKNIMTLLKAYASMEDIKQDIVIVSKKFPYWNEVCVPFLKDCGLEERVHIISGVSDPELRYIYEHADLFVTCSTHEGFGYTPIEAAVYKCPVISTRCEALADTTQDKLFYYDNPYDYKELASKIQQVLNNPPTEEQLENVSEFFQMKYDVLKQKKEILSLLTGEGGVKLKFLPSRYDGYAIFLAERRVA